MSKKLNWLDQFAEEQAKKMQKSASLNKKAEQIIVDPNDVPGCAEGQEVSYNNETYKVVNSNFKDEIGVGVVLEKVSVKEAAVEDEMIEAPVVDAPVGGVESDPAMQMEMGTNPMPAAPMGQKKVTDAPEYARTNPGNVYHVEVRDTVEVDKFQGEATQTEQQIAGEDAVDATTPEGRVNRVLNRMMSNPVVPAIPTEEAPVEEVPVEETPVEETPVAEEVPVEEVPAEEVPVEEEVPAPAEDITETPETDEDEEENKLANNRILRKILSYRK